MANLTTEMMTIVSANTRPYQTAMKRGERATRSFSKVVSSLGVGALKSFARGGAAAAGAITAYLTLQKAAEVTKRSISLAAEFEQQQVAFEVLLGSVRDAKQLMKEIQQFAASTPFQQTELQDAAKSLVAFGVESGKIVPTMRTLGNLSAGLGINIGELAEIYGKAKVQGRLFMEDINQLTGRGIPVIGALAKEFGVAESEIRNMVSSGQVNFTHLEKAFVSLTSQGGKFDGMIDKQSQTFNGLVSTLKDNVDVALREVGQTMMEQLNLKAILRESIVWVKKFTPGLIEAVKTTYNLGQGLVGVGEVIGASFIMGFNEAKLAALSFNDVLIDVAKKTAFLLEVTGQSSLADSIKSLATANETLNKNRVKEIKQSNAEAALLMQQGSTRYAQSRVGAFKNFGGGEATGPAAANNGPSFWQRAAIEGKANRYNGLQSLLGFGRSLAGVGGSLGSRFIADMMNASPTQMGPNSGILKGSSQAVSLEAERNRAQLDVGKSQLEVMRNMDQKLQRLIDFGAAQKEKAMDAFGGLF